MSGGGGAFAPFVTPPPPPASSYQQPAPSSHFTYVAPADSRASQYSAGNSGGGVYSEPRVVQPEPQQTEKYSTSSQVRRRPMDLVIIDCALDERWSAASSVYSRSAGRCGLDKLAGRRRIAVCKRRQRAAWLHSTGRCTRRIGAQHRLGADSS